MRYRIVIEADTMYNRMAINRIAMDLGEKARIENLDVVFVSTELVIEHQEVQVLTKRI